MNRPWNRRTIQLLCFFIFVAGSFSDLLAAESGESDKELSFEWAFVARSQKNDVSDIQPITKDIKLKSGDQLKIMLDVINDCHVYILHDDSYNHLIRLFPKETTSPERSLSPGVSYLPDGESWYILGDGPGTEQFHLIASSKRLIELENLLDKYENALEAKRAGVIKEIKQYIKETRKQHNPLSSAAERPLMIGGSFRNAMPKSSSHKNISEFAESIHGDTFFARTFTISHK